MSGRSFCKSIISTNLPRTTQRTYDEAERLRRMQRRFAYFKNQNDDGKYDILLSVLEKAMRDLGVQNAK